MQKNLTQFKSVINGIENYFHFDSQCPVNIAKDALLECLKWVGQIEDIAKSQQAEKEAQEAQKAQNNPIEDPEITPESQEETHE